MTIQGETAMESTSRRFRPLVYVTSALPLVVAAILVFYTAKAVGGATTQVAALKAESERLQNANEALRQEVAQNSVDLKRIQKEKETAVHDFSNTVYVDWAMLNTDASKPVLRQLVKLAKADPAWLPSGQVWPNLDSATFAYTVLFGKERTKRLRADEAFRQLQQLPSTEQPEPGDLILYEDNYAMFLVPDESIKDHIVAKSVVIGLTPFGVKSLRSSFRKIVGYRRTAGVVAAGSKQ
jgi:hypothetical protein